MDNHEAKMAAGQSAMGYIEAIDDELIATTERLAEAVREVRSHMIEHGVEGPHTYGAIVGMVLGVLQSDDA